MRSAPNSPHALHQSAMASPSPSQYHQDIKSHFQPTVCLADWWLITAENDFQGRRLAVAGYTSREKQAIRVFSSAPIRKRHDLHTLETSDGICVILDGFMNKARTTENRFPSEVCDHFVIGFPPYWKEYDEKFISKDSSSGNMLRVDPVKKLSPQSEVESGQLHDDGHEHDGVSQDGMNSEDVLRSGKAKCITAPFPQRADCIISVDKSNMSSISSGVHDHHRNNAATTFQDQMNLNMLLDTPKGTANSLTYSDGGVTTHTPGVNVKVVDCQINDCGKILFTHGLSGSSRSKMAGKVELGKKNVKANVFSNAPSSEVINDQKEGSMKTCAMHGSTRDQKSNERKVSISGDEMSRLTSPSLVGDEKAKSASAAWVPGGTNRWNSEGRGLRKRTGTCSVGDEFERISEIPSQNEEQQMIKIRDKQKEKQKATSVPGSDAAAEQMFETPIHNEDRKVIKIRDKQKKKNKTRSHPQAVDAAEQMIETPRQNEKLKMLKLQGRIHQAKHKATRLPGASASGGEAADKQKQTPTAVESSLSDSAKVSKMKTKAYETPNPGKEEACDTSNKFLGFTRSRSGRLLVPPLMFWSNQRAIYDMDRTVTGIQECLPMEEPRKGSRSEPSRKRRT